MKLVIVGNDGAGKSTLAKRLVQDFGLDSTAISPLADYPRIMVARRYGYPLPLVYEKPTPAWLRKQLIDECLSMEAEFGYDKTRQTILEFWVNRHGQKRNWVVDDCRYDLEVLAFRKLGALVLHISHPPTGSQTGAYYDNIEGLAGLAHLHTTYDEVRKPAFYEKLREYVLCWD